MSSRIFTDGDLDRAEGLRAEGKKWREVEDVFGEGIQGACARRAKIRSYDEERERARFNSVLRDQHGIIAAWCSEQREYRDPAINFAWEIQKALKMRELTS